LLATLACRIAAQTQGRQILVSSLLHELTESAGVIVSARQMELKGWLG